MSAVVDERCMGEDEKEEDTLGSGLAECLRLEAVVYSNQPLPILNRRREEVDMLIDQQKAGVSLMRRKAEKCEDGYLWEDGVLVWTRVVVPSCRHREVIDVGHRGLARRHFSHKIVVNLTQHLTWSGLRKDVRSTVAISRMPEDRQAAPTKIPLTVTAIISVPYQCLSCNLVGPLNRTKRGKRGLKYILTVICLGTRYLNAIQVKKVDVITVT